MNGWGKIGNGGKALLVTGAFFVVAFGLKYTREVTLPLVMAVFLAIASHPIVSGLRKWLKLPHWLAVTCAVVVDIALICGLISLTRYMFTEIQATVPDDIFQKLKESGQGGDFEETTPGGGILKLFIHEGKIQNVNENVSQLVVWCVQTYIGQAITYIFSITGRVLAFVSYTTLVLILMTFFLGEAPLFRRNLVGLAKRYPVSERVLTVLSGVQKYIIIKTLASVCTGLLAWGLCSVAGVPLPFLWGVVACVLNFIPTIGSIVAAIPPVALAMTTQDWQTGLVVAGGYVAINFAIGNGIEPIFLGKQFGMATSMVLLSVIVWGWIWGPAGMLLAIPITLFVKLALENSTDLRWVAALVDDAPNPERRDKTEQP